MRMKTLCVLAVALLATMVSGQGNTELETEFGPFENSTHRCNFDCSRAVDLALIIDASGSIKDAGKDNWDKVINFTIDIIDNFDIGQWGTHVSLVTYSTKATVRFYLNQYMSAEEIKEQIMKHKENWYVGGWTNTYEGLFKMKTEVFAESNGDRPAVPDIAIVVTDGKSSFHERPDKYNDPIPMAREAEEAGIKVYVVGVTDNVLESELEAISAAPYKKGETYWTTPRFDTIMEVMKTLLLKTCRAICIPKNMVCNKAIDLAFVVDASGSIQRSEEKDMDPPQNTNWWLIMGFIKNIIDKFTIGENDVRVGVVTFSNMGIARVKLNDYFEAADLKAATNHYGWFGDGRTNTWEGLNVMRTEIFTKENGDRDNVPNIAIVLTDGQSSHDKRPWQFKDPIPEAGLAKQDGIKVFGVGVTKKVNTVELEAIASEPPMDMETVFVTMDFDSLSNVIQPFLESLMGQSCFLE